MKTRRTKVTGVSLPGSQAGGATISPSELKSLTRNPVTERRWTALLRGRKLRLPWRMASGSWQPPRGWRPMPAWERESGELPSPICPCSTERSGRDLLFFVAETFNIEHSTPEVQLIEIPPDYVCGTFRVKGRALTVQPFSRLGKISACAYPQIATILSNKID